MSKKNYRRDSDNPRQQFEDEFEDFGYEVKNIRRSSKKKVAKFKREQDHYDDSFWSVHYMLTGWADGVLYRSRREITWPPPSSSIASIALRLTRWMLLSTPSFTSARKASARLLRAWTANTIASWMRLWRHGVRSPSRSVVTLYHVCHRMW